jgi:tripartite-type tricarboxylate transporter receptor subunit TctC
MVVPYPPGGPNDVIARILAQKLSEALGGQFYVENQAGAGGTIGAGAVANASADGHTMLVANQDIIVQPIIKAKVPYDPFKSFAPVTLVVGAPEMIVVNPTLPVQSMKELFALLKANPGKYSYASPGYGTTPHLACEWLFKLTYGLDVVHVPFQGAAPAVQSVLAGHTPIFHNVLPAVAPHIRQGTMRALAVASSKRSPFFPDVPSRHSGPRGWILDGRLAPGRSAQADRRSAAGPSRQDPGAVRRQGATGNDRFRSD